MQAILRIVAIFALFFLRTSGWVGINDAQMGLVGTTTKIQRAASKHEYRRTWRN